MIQQWEIWKCRVPGISADHWFVIISGQERLDDNRHRQINGLLCTTLQGSARLTDVVLNSADGFARLTACQCDLLYFLKKSECYEKIGSVCEERRGAIKAKLKDVLRFH